MFRQLLTFTLVLCMTANLFGQRLEIQYPFDRVAQFFDVYVAPGGTGFAVGSCGTIAKTTNSGMSWTMTESPSNLDFDAVVCRPNTNCQTVMAAADGLYARSTDGGNTWDIEEGEDWEFINEMHGLNNNVILAEGFRNYRRSTDGGVTWTTLELPADQSGSIQFADATTGYYFANGTNELYKTENAGAAWNSTAYVHPVSVRRFTFHNAQIGWIWDSEGKIHKTTDGGVNWTDLGDSGLVSNLRLLTSISDTQLRGFSVTDRYWASDDNGVTWTSDDLTSDDGIFIKSKFHRNGDEFWFVSNMSEIFYTPDAFTNIESGIPANRVETQAIALLDNGVGLVSDSDGKILKTTNSGDDWTELETNMSFSRGIKLKTLPNGNVLGIFSGLLPVVTTDGGSTWSDYLPANIGALVADDLPGDFVIAPGGRYHLVGSSISLYSDDAGASWTPVAHAGEMAVSEVYFFDANLGFAAGFGSGRMMRTTDGGLTWENLTDVSPTSQPVNEFYFSDANDGIVFSGSRGFRTTDGGDTWTNDNSVPGAYQLVETPDGKLIVNSFGSGNNADIFMSQDQGETWSSIAYYCSPSRHASISPDGRYYYTVGDGGVIARIDLDVVNSVRVPTRDIQAIKAYPNPTSGLVSIELPTAAANQQLTLEVYNLTGQKVYQQNFNNPNRLEINLSDQPAGVYTVRLNGDGWMQTGKVVLEK